jgi:regulator of replication initiation timing
MLAKIDFIYEENPDKIQAMRQAYPRVKEKYKNQKRKINQLAKISTYLQTTMDQQQMGSMQKTKKFELSENNTLHLRNQNLREPEIISVAEMLKQIKDNDKSIRSISFSYNKDIGDDGMALLMRNMPVRVGEIGCVGCGMTDEGGGALLEWMKKSQNLQMICVEQNNFSADIKQRFRDFKKQNPHIIIIY